MIKQQQNFPAKQEEKCFTKLLCIVRNNNAWCVGRKQAPTTYYFFFCPSFCVPKLAPSDLSVSSRTQCVLPFSVAGGISHRTPGRHRCTSTENESCPGLV